MFVESVAKQLVSIVETRYVIYMKFVKRIDYPLLRKQKESLINRIGKQAGKDHFEGILNLIDALQDAVVEVALAHVVGDRVEAAYMRIGEVLV